MERKSVAICSLVGFLALLSAAAGIAAEATRTVGEAARTLDLIHQGSQDEFVLGNQCSYPRTPVMALGLTAAAALMVGHLIINVSTGCICSKSKRNSNPSNPNLWRLLPVIFFALSWVKFAIAFVLLLTGVSLAYLNQEHGEGNNFCSVEPQLFHAGAGLSLASLMLGIAYHLTARMAKSNLNVWGNPAPTAQGAVALGQPQGSQEPIFVPHDTYMRREFP